MVKVMEKPKEIVEDEWKSHEVEMEKPKKPALKPKVELINNIYDLEDVEFDYPFSEMELNQGFFIPNAPNQTTLDNAKALAIQIGIANKLFSVIELDENGDEVWEDVYIRTTKRNSDGSVQLDGGGWPIIGHDPIARPNIIYNRRFAARQLVKGDTFGNMTADVDGVLIVRVV